MSSVLVGVERAGRLLGAFSHHQPTMSVQGASAALGISPSAAYRLLRSLEFGGLLVYDPEARSYRLSARMAHLGQVALSAIDWRAVARPYLRRLKAETGETVVLLVKQGQHAVVVDIETSDHPLRLSYPVGEPWPLHAGATNLVLLAYLPEEEIDAILGQRLVKVTARTVTVPGRLRRKIQRIRRRGYAYTVGELTPGVAAVAVPVHAEGRLLGGLAILGPQTRVPPSRVPHLVGKLRSAALAIRADLAVAHRDLPAWRHREPERRVAAGGLGPRLQMVGEKGHGAPGAAD
ncbi:MAG: IclR family transcriptional regulator [Armatimonadota bacterium]|nr:IclR family transcriptional regulator [Armatimonadota bacterium]MDR7549065.1 IclR family transcriptional regulator [Armatimonadota bacterium]